MLTNHSIPPQPVTDWAVVTTHPHREKIALENLSRQGFQAYCPIVRKRLRHPQRIRDVVRPLFPGYVFVALDRQSHLMRSVHSTFGARGIVRFGDQLGKLNSDFIEGLKAREVDGALESSKPAYRVGQAVCMTEGAFDGMIAKIVEMDERNRFVVLMDFLNRSVRIRVDESGVTAV